MSYYFTTTIEGKSFEESLLVVRKALQAEGFGVLTEIDVKVTFKKKLDKDFKPYRILGACNPEFAYKAIEAEDKIGTMLPCNVVVEQQDDGSIAVTAVDPIASMTAVGNENLRGIAHEVQNKLKKVIEGLG